MGAWNGAGIGWNGAGIGWNGNGMGWDGGGISSLGWLGVGMLTLVLLSLMIWIVVRSMLLPDNGDESTHPTGDSALKIPDRQLASGQIDRESRQVQRTALLSVRRDTK